MREDHRARADRHGWNLFDPRIVGWRLGGQGRDEQLRSLGELRRGVEPVAAALAAVRATPEQCGALTGAVMDMAVHGRSGDLEAYLAADIVDEATRAMLRADEAVAEEAASGRATS